MILRRAARSAAALTRKVAERQMELRLPDQEKPCWTKSWPESSPIDPKKHLETGAFLSCDCGSYGNLLLIKDAGPRLKEYRSFLKGIKDQTLARFLV